VEQVIERHLTKRLAHDTLSPMIINDMTDAEVAEIAAEPTDITSRRTMLEGHKEILESGRAAFKQALRSST
jgi:hypothetical protein